MPAYFSDAQRQATREAGEIAGLEVVRIINEPTAAALVYEAAQHEGKRILVYDLGGGTFDVSVVRIEDGVVEVISSHGNNHLGGDDFDEKLVAHILDHLKIKHGVDLSDQPRAMARILRGGGRRRRSSCRITRSRASRRSTWPKRTASPSTCRSGTEPATNTRR